MSEQNFPPIGTAEERALRERIRRLEHLIQEVDHYKDPEARTHTRQIVQALMDLHGAGLEKILERLAATGEAGLGLIDSLAQDDLVASLLLLYSLHPLDLETRVRQALEKVRPYLASHGGNVELLGVADGIVRLRLQGSCHGCPSSALTLKQTIEEAICEKAPDATSIEVEGEITQLPALEPVGGGRIALPILAQ
jgi:Fe-S cluster biogenesis protein NfuA